MSDRAEQAKALIVGETYENAIERITELTAALTTSEAEVTRLETGIAEAESVITEWRDKFGTGTRIHEVMGKQVVHVDHVAEKLLPILKALSQPTTDTNGAHA